MTLHFEAVEGIGEVAAGDDLAALIAAATTLADDDVVVVTSKIVSKAAGLTTTRSRDELLAEQTDRVVARRRDTAIVRTRHGLTMAAAGIDGSNTSPGTLVPLPPDPDASAAAIRSRLLELTGARVAVVVSDTSGRAWRRGQIDIAIGCSGMVPIESFAGRTDPYGNPLAVTAPAVVDQLASGAELASGKLGARPVVLVRGADPAWFTADDGPGASALIRDESTDMFGLGAREAAVAAIIGDAPVRGLPADDSTRIHDLVDLALAGASWDPADVHVDGAAVTLTDHGGSLLAAGMLMQRLISLGTAHGIRLTVTLRPPNR